MSVNQLPQKMPQILKPIPEHASSSTSQSASQFKNIVRAFTKYNGVNQFVNELVDQNRQLRKYNAWVDEAAVTVNAAIDNTDILIWNTKVLKRKIQNRIK
ncbi:Hypothetical_protein [Hexamita inflata]|uniref:Hypothetical_protein n=1 Tax=Hexamita inflata TaxID=28002 RepID=A0ABP1HFQ6_9EUKA